MCHYQTLFHHENTGYIIRCTQCQQFQIGFGSVIISMDETEFGYFCEWVARTKTEQTPMQDPFLKSLVIPTPCEGLKLFLSQRELNELNEMLETADNEWKSTELLKLFKSGSY
jgi:hypothetical protein